MSERRIFRVPVTLDKAARKKDRTISLAETTNLEISNEEFATMDTFVGHSGWLIFAEDELQAMDVPKENAQGKDTKSPGTRLRGVLWHIWDKNTDRAEDFEVWYHRQMEKIIEKLKEQLDN